MKTKEKNKIVVLVDSKVYSLEAIYAAAYLFLDRAYFYLEEGSKSKVKVNIKGKKKLTGKKLENLKDEFLNELLNSSLREKISKNNKKLREYIFGRVLASALEKNNYENSQKQSCDQLETSKKYFKEEKWDENDLIEEFTKDLSQDWKKDPEGIAIPWEEKYLSQDKKKLKNKKIIKNRKKPKKK